LTAAVSSTARCGERGSHFQDAILHLENGYRPTWLVRLIMLAPTLS
jgi:hypothetical protein